MNQNKWIKDLGEQGLLKRIQSFCATEIVGDDGAVLDLKSDRQLVVTTDVLVDQVHFSDRTTSAFDVGWRAAAANLSDLAAMGAEPIGITVGLSLPGKTLTSWVEDLYRGLSSCLQQFSTPIVGGDLTRSNVIAVAITALGQVSATQVITRSQAQPGDAILITGYHGNSRAGLELLLNPEQKVNLSDRERNFLIKAHQRPQARLDVISKLRAIAPETKVAGMDSSDGLGDAIVQICNLSKVSADIHLDQIPISPALEKLTTNYPVLEWLFNGGEDFELVLTLEPALANKLLAALSPDAAVIGQIRATEPQLSQIRIFDQQQIIKPEESQLFRGFQHFSS